MYIAENPFTKLDIESEVFKLLELFTIVLYDKSCAENNIHKAWKWIFPTRARDVINLPPTQDALHQRSICQSSTWMTNAFQCIALC